LFFDTAQATIAPAITENSTTDNAIIHKILMNFIIPIYILFLFLCQYTSNKFRGIAHNVPAVYDVFAVAIKETVGFQQPQKCAGEKPHKGRSPTAVFRRPRGFSPEA
jgi:hypothetical protein